ncbi:MAG: hypothetical protein M3539_15470 [Acidobacteriota bacterium]|nr:hypothetical protein [Acidobacteriota bacterium]
MKRFALAIALACAISGTALAGDIHTTGVQAPEPPSQTSPADTGDIHTTDAASTQGSSELLTNVILTIIGLAVS